MKKKKAKSKKKVATTNKKSYYKPKKKTAKVTKKKYKSYYKSKKVREYEAALAAAQKKAKKNPKMESALIPPLNVKETDITEINVPVTEKVSKRPVKYLNNKDLLAQVILSKKQGKMTNELAKMLQLLTLRYGKKGNFANYTYNDDMQSYAMLMIVKTWQGFDPAKSSNPFAWFTQCIKNSFIQYLNYEKRQRDIRDEVLVDSGMLPSYNYQQEYAEEQRSGDSPENENVELPTKPSHNDVTFEVPEEDDTPVEVLQY